MLHGTSSSRVVSPRLTGSVAAVVIAMALGTYVGVPRAAGTQAARAASRLHVGQLLRLAKLGAGAEGGESETSSSVALSANADTALIGAPDADGGVGSVSVFTRSGSRWIQQGPALAGNGEVGEGSFGWSVALSGDGAVALVGGRTDGASREGGCCARGAVWVFRRSGATWTQQAELTDGRAGEDGEFGSSVALSRGGGTALIGASGFGHAGAAWIFTATRSGWQRRAELTGRGASPDAFFGSSVALASDGETALIGADGNKGGGAAWVFTRRHSRWITQGARLVGKENSAFARFGTAVALSSAGDTALIGAGGEDGERGTAWIFTRSGSSWQRRKKLTARGETPLGNFGESVALSSSGKTALIGCPMDNGSGLERVGAAWLFSGSGSSWTQRAEIVAPPTSGEDGLFGESLALSGAGTTALAGVEVDDGDPGTAWVLVD
jgi:FG-GAP repeat